MLLLAFAPGRAAALAPSATGFASGAAPPKTGARSHKGEPDAASTSVVEKVVQERRAKRRFQKMTTEPAFVAATSGVGLIAGLGIASPLVVASALLWWVTFFPTGNSTTRTDNFLPLYAAGVTLLSVLAIAGLGTGGALVGASTGRWLQEKSYVPVLVGGTVASLCVGASGVLLLVGATAKLSPGGNALVAAAGVVTLLAMPAATFAAVVIAEANE